MFKSQSIAAFPAMLLSCLFMAVGTPIAALGQPGGNVVRNGGFEEEGTPARDWTQDVGKTGDKGAVARDAGRARSGRAALRLSPNGRNGPPHQLAVSQELALGAHRGKTVEMTVAMRADGEARAMAGLIIIGRGGPKLMQLGPGVSGVEWAIEKRQIDLPDDPSARYYLALWVDGGGGAAWFDDASVVPAGAAPVTGAGPFDAWNPPLGEAVQNLVLAEGWTDARLVAPPVNVVGNGGWTDSVAVSRDGRRLFFAYAKWDYFIFESTLKFVPTGPDKTAGHGGEEMQMYQADLTPAGWTVSRHPLNPGPAVTSGSLGLNGAEDLAFYNSYRFTPSYATSMRFATKANGVWTQKGPLPAPINSPAGCLDDNGFVIGSMATGATLYFESTRVAPNGAGCGKKRRLYFATYQAGAWSEVQPVPGIYSGSEGDDDTQVSVSEDKARIYWTGNRPSQGKYGLFTADWNGRTYANPRMIIGIRTFNAPWARKVVRLGEPNVAELPQGSVMYFICGVALGDTPRGAPDNIQNRVCFARKPR